MQWACSLTMQYMSTHVECTSYALVYRGSITVLLHSPPKWLWYVCCELEWNILTESHILDDNNHNELAYSQSYWNFTCCLQHTCSTQCGVMAPGHPNLHSGHPHLT